VRMDSPPNPRNTVVGTGSDELWGSSSEAAAASGLVLVGLALRFPAPNKAKRRIISVCYVYIYA
jgi:hypothetical protein